MMLQALCFDCEEDMLAALEKDTEKFRGKVVIIRWDYASYHNPNSCPESLMSKCRPAAATAAGRMSTSAFPACVVALVCSAYLRF
jgi:hypothetical protein